MPQRGLQQRRVALGDGVEASLQYLEDRPMLVGHPQHFGAEHRRQRQGDESRNHHGAGDRDPELAQQASGRAAQEPEGREHRHQRDRRRDHGKADLVGAVDRGLLRRLVQLLLVPVRILEHDDGVVHHDADGDREREQREVVDREAEEIHDGERRHDRRRNREAGDHGRSQVPQEHEYDQHDQDRRDQERQTCIVDRVRDEHGPIERGFELDARRQRLLNAGDRLADALRHVDQVRLRLPDHTDGDRRNPIVAKYRASVLGPKLDVCNILELHDLPALTRHDHLPEFPRRLQLAQRPDRELPPRRLDAAGGNLDVARDDRAFHVLHGEASCRQLVGLYPRAHREAPLDSAGAL